MLLFNTLKNIKEVLETCIKPGLHLNNKNYDLDYTIWAVLESVAGKITEGLICDIINTENDCVSSANEHVKLGSFLGETVKHDW